jgi:F-type H+-transporting ATPase subunit delta
VGPTIIARNYAETLLALAERHGGQATAEAYARAMDEVAELMRREPRVREFLETPRIGSEEKQRVLRDAFSGRVPEHFLRFLLVVVQKRRQALLPAIAEEFHALLDEVQGRVRAEVTVATEPAPDVQREIVASLERKLGRTVVASFRVDAAILGGVVVRLGDRVIDGSLRRRVSDLRRQLMRARLPGTVAG